MDPTALTARETLRHALGFGDSVREVSRSEVIAFQWKGEIDARAVLDRLVQDTNLLQNPNKHHLEIAVGSESLGPRGNIWVLVSREGDGAALGPSLARRRLVRGEAPETALGTLWELSLEGTPENRRRLAQSMAVARGRVAGLLSNPHVEDMTVFEVAPSAGDVVTALGLASHPTAT
jgi:phosphoribosylformylglycinamidine (FGAM) synthase PurS component